MEPKETTPASRRLGRDEAAALLDEANRLLVAKGRRLQEFVDPSSADQDALAAMLGPTGNLRAPTLRVGDTVLVGFNEEQYSEVLGV